MKQLISLSALIVLLCYANAHAQINTSPLSNQTTNLINGASCVADDLEDDEIELSADAIDAEFNKERTRIQRKLAGKKDDPYGVESALTFFAPSIFPDQFTHPFTEDDTYKKDFNRVSNYNEYTKDKSTAVNANKNAFNSEKTDFYDGKYSTVGGDKTEPTSEQKAAMDAYTDRLLEVLMANKECESFQFDLTKSKFSEKYFADFDKAKAFATDHKLHAENLERCEGPLEHKKSVTTVAAPISQTSKTLECPGLESYFLDNQWELEPDQVMAANTKVYKAGTCEEISVCDANSGLIQEKKGQLQNNANNNYAAAQKAIDSCVAQLKDKEIISVDIESSASRYKNTGIACGMSFADLSKNRAESAQELFLKSLDTHKIEYKKDTKSGVKIAGDTNPYLFDIGVDFGGEWGDKIETITKEGKTPDPKFLKLVGTSGPAPGAMEKSEYDQYKYVKIKIEYKDKLKHPAIPADDAGKKYQVICKSIGYNCTNETSSVRKYHPSKVGGHKTRFPKKKYSKAPKRKKMKKKNSTCFFTD